MDWEAIKSELEYNHGYFPRDALDAALAQHVEVMPFLLDELARHARDPEGLTGFGDSYFLHIYAMYLLAQFSESRAHADILTLVIQPGDYAFQIMEEMVTGDLYAVLARTCGGDVSGIKRLIENADANAYVRGAGLRALAAMVAAGEHPRDEFVEYLRGLFGSLPRRPESDDPLWINLVQSACDIHPRELMGEIERVFADELIDPWWFSMQVVEQALARGVEQTLDIHRERDSLEVDAMERLDSWACFHPEADKNGEAFDDGDEYVETYVRATPKIGRNDPCPCGSGKKYKRCCLDKSA